MNVDVRQVPVTIKTPTRSIGAADEAAAPAAAPEAARVAVVVCHGMGQQVPFETLGVVAEALERADAERNGERDDSMRSAVQLIDHRGERIPRAELKVRVDAASPPALREVHLYEAYWAPLAAEKIGAVDALRFLLKAGAKGLAWYFRLQRVDASELPRPDGARTAERDGATRRRVGIFRRWMFGGFVAHRLGASTPFGLVAALAVVLAIAVLGVAALLVAAGLVARATLGIETSPLVGALRPRLYVAVAEVLLSLVVALALVWLVGKLSLRIRSESTLYDVARALMGLVVAVPLVVLALWGLVAIPATALGHTGPAGAATYAWLVEWAPVVAARSWLEAWEPVGAWLAARERFARWPWAAVVVWPVVIATGVALERFLAGYLGDVAIYVSSHEVSRFQETRRQIQQAALSIARAVYGAESDGRLAYDRVVMVGHSLGSVVAYDTLNAMINEDLLVARAENGEGLRVVERTPVLLTFGSPLDKTAFMFRAQQMSALNVREALAAAVQPMIRSYELRPATWVNIYSSFDWISGSIEYYDKPGEPGYDAKRVENVVDAEAYFPLYDHTTYWKHEAFRRRLYDAVAG